jgi:hypothetical protein
MTTFFKGASWFLFTGDSPSCDAAINHQLSISRRLREYCSIRLSLEHGEQLVTAPAEAEGQICAALLLASTKSSIVFLERQTLDQYWLVVISHGKVMPGFDTVGNLEHIEYKLEDLCRLLASQPEQFSFFGDERSVPTLKKFISQPITETTLDALIAPLSYEIDRNASLKFRLTNTPRSYRPLLIRAGVLLALVVATYFGIQLYHEHLREKELAETITLKTPQQLFAERLLSQKQSLLPQIERSSLLRLADNSLVILRQLPNSLGGWKLKQVSFSRTSKTAKVNFIHPASGDIGLFKQALAKRYPNIDMAYSMDGQQIRFEIPLKTLSLPYNLNDFDEWKAASTFPLSSYIDSLSRFQFNWKIEENTPLNATTIQAPLPYRRLSFEIESKHIHLLEPFATRFKDYGGMIFETITFDVSEAQMKWTLKGFIYEFK